MTGGRPLPEPYHFGMWQEKRSELLSQEIDAVLASLPDVGALRSLISEPLEREGRGVIGSQAKGSLWPLLPLMVSEAICGDWRRALPIAASRQFLLAAADVFDDIEDADSSQSLSAKYGIGAATNIATTLLILAEKAMTRLKMRGVTDDITVQAVEILNYYYVFACAGQHLDLVSASTAAHSEEAYLEAAEMKSASQMECACYLGALVAGASKELTEKFSAFGCNLGMASQIANDIQGIIDGSDIINPKLTLPVIFGLNNTNANVREGLSGWFLRHCEPAPDASRIRDALFHSGAMHYALLKMELYKQQAQDILSEVEKSGVNITRLQMILS